MARRSPMNDRYKKDAKVGSTRRSAASAKPKRELGEASSSKSSGSAKKPASKGRILLPNPDTPEFRRWNIINYSMLGAALAAAILVLLVQQQARSNPNAMILGLVPAQVLVAVLWAVWGLSLAASMYIQFGILRKMRNEWESSGKASAKAKQDAEAKAAKESAKGKGGGGADG